MYVRQRMAQSSEHHAGLTNVLATLAAIYIAAKTAMRAVESGQCRPTLPLLKEEGAPSPTGEE